MANTDDSSQGSASFQTRALRAVAIAIIAAIVAGTFIAFSYDRVCNQQVTAAGRIVAVCRHLEATDPPVIAGGLVVLAFLGVFFTEISGFGLSLKRQVEQVKGVAEEARGAAHSAQSAAQVAQDLSLRPSPERSDTALEASALERRIRTLADEYNATRRAMPSGTPRTSKMTSIITNMIAMLNDVRPAPFDLLAYLDGEDEGRRLAGYAYLYANPEPLLAPKVAAALVKDNPFGQYWALRTLNRQIETDPDALDLNTRRSLEDLLGSIGIGTDRSYELRQLLRESP